MNRAARLLIACAFVLSAHASQGPPARAESLDAIFRDANQAYFEGELERAVQRYEQLISAGVRDADLYFNLGLAYARSGKLGHAILYFERCARAAPASSDLTQALATAHASLGKRRAKLQGEATVQARPPLLTALLGGQHENTFALLVLGFELALFTLLLARRFLRAEALRTGCAVGAALCALGLFGSAFSLLEKRGAFDEGRAAVVLHEGAELREGPDPRARSRALAHEGASAELLHRDGAFVRVRIRGGAEGWMQASDVGLVAPD